MKTQGLVLLIFAACLVFAACQNNKKINAAAPSTPQDTQKALNRLNTKLGVAPACDQYEAALKISNEERAQKVVFEHKSDIRDVEYVDCDGRVEMKRKVAPLSFTKVVDIEDPEWLRDEVDHIEVENLRNCHTSQATAVEDETLDEAFKLLHKAPPESMMTSVSHSGFTKLVVVAPGAIALGKTSLSEGVNKIRIRYFGTCLEFNQTCLRSQLLGEKSVIIEVKTKLTQGLKRVENCPKRNAKK